MALGRKTGGRQKGSLNLSTREMREMAQGMAKDVLDTLKNILDDATQPGEVRIKAGKENSGSRLWQGEAVQRSGRRHLRLLRAVRRAASRQL